MGRLDGLHEISTFGKAIAWTFEGATTGQAEQLLLSSDPGAGGPQRFMVLGTKQFRVRQGDSNVTVTANDPLLQARTYYAVTVTSEKNNYLGIMSAQDDCTIQAFEVGSLDPETGTSSRSVTTPI